MRKLIPYVLTFIFTFTLGVTVVWPTLALGARFFVNADLIRVLEPVLPEPRFTPWGRGCGNGYVQSYITNDDQKVAEGVTVYNSPKEARKAIQQMLRSSTVVEHGRVSHVSADAGRYVLVDKADPHTASIVRYDDSEAIKFIDAPSLDLALEFEQYLLSINFRSPF